MREDKRHAHGIPGPLISMEEVLRFFRDVGIPDQHVLREAGIRPEHDDGKHPFAQIVVMLHGDRVFENAVAAQPQRDERDHRDTGKRAVGQAVERRKSSRMPWHRAT